MVHWIYLVLVLVIAVARLLMTVFSRTRRCHERKDWWWFLQQHLLNVNPLHRLEFFVVEEAAGFHAIDVHDTIEMIKFMLEHASREIRQRLLDFPTFAVFVLHLNFLCTLDDALVAGNTETAFKVARDRVRHGHDLWIQHLLILQVAQVIFIVRHRLEHKKHAQVVGKLRRCNADTSFLTLRKYGRQYQQNHIERIVPSEEETAPLPSPSIQALFGLQGLVHLLLTWTLDGELNE